MSYYFYLLKSLKDNKFYSGATNNLQRRFKEHNLGKSKATKNRLPFELIYSQEFETKHEAFAFEWKFKHTKETRFKILKKIEKRHIGP